MALRINDKITITLVKDVSIIKIAGAKDNTVSKNNTCRLKATSSGVSAASTLTPIRGTGICGWQWATGPGTINTAIKIILKQIINHLPLLIIDTFNPENSLS
jgi:hypothetical protein